MAWFMEHRRDVPGGDIRAYTAGGSSRGPESASGSSGVLSVARDGTEDVTVRGAARLSATLLRPRLSKQALPNEPKRKEQIPLLS
jgi:hypothetical protein